MKHFKQWALTALLVLAIACSSSDDPAPTPPTPDKSSAKALTGLQFTPTNNVGLNGITYIALIDESAKTALLRFPYGTDVSALKPTFTLSDKASLKIGGVVQTSNSSVWNLLGPLTLSVTAENGTTASYTLTTEVSLPSDPLLADAITYFGKAVYKADFPVSKLKDLTYETTINQNSWLGTATDVGATAANAIVLLVFDKTTGLLYTPKRYNAQFNTTAIASTADIEEWFTDIATYKQITGVVQATAAYAQHTFALANNGTPFWIFDAYASSFETNAAKEAAIVAKLAALPDANSFTVPVPQWAKLANITYYSVSYKGNRYQQNSCVNMETRGIVPGTIYNNRVDQLLNTGVAQADGYGTRNVVMTISGGGTAYDTPNRTGCASFALSSLTAAQKDVITEFLISQGDPVEKPYKLTISTTGRNSDAHYYAAKLPWLAYMQVGVNIDGNGGSFVFGDDIIFNPIFTGMRF